VEGRDVELPTQAFEAFYAAHRLAVAGYVRRRVDGCDDEDVLAQVSSATPPAPILVAWHRRWGTAR